jgi:hypothetical protein
VSTQASSQQVAPAPQDAPSATSAQTPTFPGRVQVRHAPAQGWSQQTPCAQTPDWHSSAVAHGCPSGWSPRQTPSAQNAAPTHWALAVQLVRQAVPSGLQTKRPQLVVVGWQVPFPPQA